MYWLNCKIETQVINTIEYHCIPYFYQNWVVTQ